MRIKFLIYAVGALALSVACQPKDNAEQLEEATFELGIAVEENDLTLTVVPSDDDAVYVAGIIMEDDWKSMGGQDGLVAYIEESISNGGELVSGAYTKPYGDLFWQTAYYVYAAQINDGAVFGNPVVEETLIYRPFVEFAPEGFVIPPSAISDNGLWVVGCSDVDSYIYDVRRDSLIVINGSTFYDITDNCVAYGTTPPYPTIWENGKLSDVKAVPEGSTDCCFFSVTPDGSKAVGYAMVDNTFAPVIYENGTISILPHDRTPSGGKPMAGSASRIGSNGYISGYISDGMLETGCAWTPECEYDLYVEDLMVYNDGIDYWEDIYGSQTNYISPNGKYITSLRTDTGDDGWASDMYAYVFDTETREVYDVPQMSYRPDYVTSQGLLFLADTERGVSTQPYVYDIHTETFSTLADYAKSNWNYSPEGLTMQGSVVGASEDGKSLLVNFAADDTYKTAIYFLPR